MTDQPSVLTERRERVLVVTLNRPDRRNAVNSELARALATALDELDADASLAVGIITGAGGYFCAGMDLKAFADGDMPWIDGRGFGGMTERASDKPLIAAVEGFAVAGGLEIALACDLIVAAKGAKLGIPEAKRSLVAAGGGLLRLPRMLPRNIANELALTGDPITAERGYELGLVNRVSEPGAALEAAVELAATIAANGPLALAASKRILRDSVDWPQSEAFELQRAIWEPIFGSADAKEGAAAFAGKRPPVWQGR
jgi:enoyl-CoA hydratase